MNPVRLSVTALAVLAVPALAVMTKTWLHAAPEDFSKGTLEKLSLRSDGRLLLAPVSSELLDASATALWAVAADSRGNVYVGGGGPGTQAATLFRVSPAGGAEAVAELEGLAIQAIAINGRDEVFAATAPDGAIYRIGSGGGSEVFYKPKARYVWALVFHPAGDLFVATGDQGEILRVRPNGQGDVFFRTEETHVRTLALDRHGNLIAGTEPGGLILRVTLAGEGFVLHQSEKREVTAVAVTGEGGVYAAAVGLKGPPPAVPAPTAAPAPLPAGASAGPAAAGGTAPASRTPVPIPPVAGIRPQVTGGSELILIHPDGYPETVWKDNEQIVYCIAVDAEGRAVFGTGNEGRLYRLEADRRYTRLLRLAPSQVTALVSGSGGRLFAATSNIGKLYAVGPEAEREGTFESEVLDAERFAYWGRISWRGAGPESAVRIATRSGNLDRPQQNWSPWDEVPLSGGSGRSPSPPARFLQYKLTLRGAGPEAPVVSAVEAAYLHRNIAPAVKLIEATPPNYKFPPQTLTLTQTRNLTLPPLAEVKRTTSKPLKSPPTQNMQYDKGHVGVRWLAEDPGDDILRFVVEIQGKGETEWKPLEKSLESDYLSWDSTAFPDGEYRVRVTASDEPSNPPQQALTAALVSEPFLIDNTPPAIENLTAARTSGFITARWRATDAATVIVKAEYSLNGGEWTVVEPAGRLSDSKTLEYEIRRENTGSVEHVVAVRVTDSFENQVVAKVVVR